MLYEEGLGGAWAPIQRYWLQPTIENREAVRKELGAEGIRSQYTLGVPYPETIAPEGYTLDAAMIARPGNMDIQLDLFSRLCKQHQALSVLPGIFPEREATLARYLG